MIYFTADQHFGHANVIKHCNRPFSSVEEMDVALIRNWNSVVKPDDEIFILGDFTMRYAADANKYLSQLNGRKYFIKGNHDKFLKGESFKPFEYHFEWVKDYHVHFINKRRFVLFHFPIAEWDQYFRDSIHLYGHVHNSEVSNERLKFLDNDFAFNVGVDVNNYFPVSFDEILNKVNAKKNKKRLT